VGVKLGSDRLGWRACARFELSAAAPAPARTSASTFTSSLTSSLSTALTATFAPAATPRVASAACVAAVVALLSRRPSAPTAAAGPATEATTVSLALRRSRGGAVLSVLAAGALEALALLRSVGPFRALRSLYTGVVVAASAAASVHPPTGSFRALTSTRSSASRLTLRVRLLAARGCTGSSSRAGGSALAGDGGSLTVLARLVGLGDLHVRVGAQAL